VKGEELLLNRIYESRLLRVSVSFLLVVASGIAVGRFAAGRLPIYSLFTASVLFGFFLLLHKERAIHTIPIQRTLLYITIIAGFVGPVLFTVKLGSVSLFPYRILLPLVWTFFLMNLLIAQGRIRVSNIKVKPYLLLLGAWFVYAVLSLGWAIAKLDAITDIVFLFMALSIVFFVVYYFSNLKDLKRLYCLWLFILAVFIIIGTVEHITGYHIRLKDIAGANPASIYRPRAVFHNTNDFATFLALSIPFAMVLLNRSKKSISRLFGACCTVGGLYLILAAGSRANLLAVLLEVAFCLLFLRSFKRRLRIASVGGVLIMVLLIFLPGPSRGIFQDIAKSVTGPVEQIDQGTGSAATRLSLLQNGLVSLYQTAGLGVGAGNIEQWIENHQVYDTHGLTSLHNWWGEVLFNYGVFVFAGYVLFYLGLVLRLYSIHRNLRDGVEKTICEALLIALVGFFFASISSSSIMALRFQWYLFGFALAFLNYWRRKEKPCLS